MRNKQAFTCALGAMLALLAGPWAAAQTLQSGPPPDPPPVVSPGAGPVPAAPLGNPLNRNPARRAPLPPDNTPPPPPDPRDSTTRPVQPPGSFDERDTVLRPGVPASGPSSP